MLAATVPPKFGSHLADVPLLPVAPRAAIACPLQCASPPTPTDLGVLTSNIHVAEICTQSCGYRNLVCQASIVGAPHGAAVSNGAPTFTAIAADKSVTVLSLRAFLQTPHARMPDLHLTREEVDDLASYILSLRAG